jgi:hypothetical protein
MQPFSEQAPPSCIKCNGFTELVTATPKTTERPEVRILICTKCKGHEFYFVIDGAYHRW